MTAPDVAYTPGDWVTVVGAKLWALVELRIDDDRVQPLWEAVDAGVEEMLDVLLRHGLRALPGFAVAGRDGDGLRYAVRSPASVELHSGDAHTEVEASNVDAWSTGRLDAPPASLTLRNAASEQALRLPTGLGIASASSLFVDFERRAATLGDAAGEPPPSAQVDAATEPVTSTQVSAGAEPVAGTQAGAEPPAEQSEQARSDHATTYYQLLVSSTTERDALLSTLREDDPGEPESAPVQAAPTEPTEPGSVPPPDARDSGSKATSEATSVWTDDLDAVTSGPDASAVEPPTTTHQPASGVIDGVPWAGSPNLNQSLIPESPAPIPPVPEVVALPSRPPFSPAPMPPVGMAPSTAQTPAYPPEPATGTPDADSMSESATISRAALLRQLADEHAGGPTLLALRCHLGHVSPTYAATCRVCGASLPEQDPVEVTRPPLGQLVLSNGSTVLLDKGVIFGRAPQSDIADAAHRPNLVRLVDSGEISRVHASVMLDGWQVLLRDLGSQNGTILTLPGHQPEQIRPHEDYVLEPGSVVSFADVVSCKFEVTG